MPEKFSNVLALILAGGLGRRMEGRSKPLLALGEKNLVARVADFARTQCDAVALNLHEATPEAIAPFAALGLPVAPDAAAGHLGPLAGILGGLDYAAAHRPDVEFLLSLPCDCPFLPDDLVIRLREGARNSRFGLACAASGGRIHPTVALWPVGLRDDLRRDLMEKEMRGVGRFQGDFDPATVEWPLAPHDPFFNVNTPDDLRQAEEILRRSR